MCRGKLYPLISNTLTFKVPTSSPIVSQTRRRADDLRARLSGDSRRPDSDAVVSGPSPASGMAPVRPWPALDRSADAAARKADTPSDNGEDRRWCCPCLLDALHGRTPGKRRNTKVDLQSVQDGRRNIKVDLQRAQEDQTATPSPSGYTEFGIGVVTKRLPSSAHVGRVLLFGPEGNPEERRARTLVVWRRMLHTKQWRSSGFGTSGYSYPEWGGASPG